MGRNIHLSYNHIDERIFFRNVSDRLCGKYRLTAFDDSIDFLKFVYMPDAVIPDLIFIDLNTPDPDAIDCVKILKEQPQLYNVPVVIYSTTGTSVYIEEVHSGTACFFIKEVYDHQDFATFIKKLVDLDWSTGSFERKEILLVYRSSKIL